MDEQPTPQALEEQPKTSDIKWYTPLTEEKNHPRLIWISSVFILITVILVTVIGGPYRLNKHATEDTSNYSEAYTQQKEALNGLQNEWAKLESKLRTAGKSEDEITRSKSEFYDYVLTTWVMKLQFESTLSDTEKKALLREVDAVMPKDYTAASNRGCAYTEEPLPLQSFFTGVTLKFSRPMVYISGSDSKREGCSPIVSGAKHELWSVEAWSGFDRSGIQKVRIDPDATFTVEGRILVKKGGLFSDTMEHYILRDSNGNISVPTFMLFDHALYPDTEDSGSYLYKDGVRVGHVVYDLDTNAVWLDEDGVPAEVVGAHEPKQRQTNYENASPVSKRYEFLRRVMFAVEDEQLQAYTEGEMIRLGLADGIYKIEQGAIVNDFGGSVVLLKEESSISVTFNNIPSGEDCRQFYFMNEPYVFGFSETFIDGIAYKNSETSKQATNRCLEEGVHMIMFRGSVSEIRSDAQAARRLNRNPYAK